MDNKARIQRRRHLQVTPIARPSLHSEVVRRLRDMILEGELAPGAQIAERELCERLEVSRTPLREALKVLAVEGLVQLRPHRSATVSRLSREDLGHTFRVMEALEALAGELACERISDAQIKEIRALHECMVAHYLAHERPQYFRVNQVIHRKIVEAAGNPVLSEVYANLSGRILQARYMANYSAVRWKQAVAEHASILSALAARDGVELSRILKRHLRHKREVVDVRLVTGS